MINYNIFKKQLSGLYLLVLLMVSTQASAQSNQTESDKETNSCGFEMSPADWKAYRAIAKAQQAAQSDIQKSNPPTLYAPVIFHIVQSATGEGVTVDQVEQALAWANEKYAPANIQFFQCAPPHVIVSNTWFNTTFELGWENDCGVSTPEYELDELHHVDNVINIYCVNTDGWSWSAGPSSIASACMDWVVFHQGHVNSRWLLAHELGHYFGLPHTFSGFDENVTRNPANPCFNCDTEGDLFCDTPADHHNNGDNDWNAGCVPDVVFDDCGVQLQPNGLNIMSYSNSACPAEDKYFSPQQRARMHFVFTTGRSYLNCSSDCIQHYALSGTHQISRTYRAFGHIHSTASLGNTVAVTYQAENYIQLQPNFRAIAGTTATFKAVIANCVSNFNDAPSEENQYASVENLPLGTGNGKELSSPSDVYKAYPNPFNKTTLIEYQATESEPVNLSIFDMNGKLIQRLVNTAAHSIGKHQVPFYGSHLPPGVYFCRLTASREVKQIRLIIAR